MPQAAVLDFDELSLAQPAARNAADGIDAIALQPLFGPGLRSGIERFELAVQGRFHRGLVIQAPAARRQRQFDVQDIDTIEYKNLPRVLQLENVRGSANKLLSLKYEIRAPFFSDLDVVLKYNKAVELKSGGTD